MADNKITFETPEEIKEPIQGLFIGDCMTNDVMLIHSIVPGSNTSMVSTRIVACTLLNDGSERQVTEEYFTKNCTVIPNGTKIIIHTNYF